MAAVFHMIFLIPVPVQRYPQWLADCGWGNPNQGDERHPDQRRRLLITTTSRRQSKYVVLFLNFCSQPYVNRLIISCGFVEKLGFPGGSPSVGRFSNLPLVTPNSISHHPMQKYGPSFVMKKLAPGGGNSSDDNSWRQSRCPPFRCMLPTSSSTTTAIAPRFYYRNMA